MKIVAFLQNLWVKDPTRAERLFAAHPDKREYILRSLLFLGGKTGRVLRGALGEELVDNIIWEESTPLIAGTSDGVFPADLSHIRKVINKHRPQVVISFGKIASKAVVLVSEGMRVEPADFKFETYFLPHPCARSSADPVGALSELKLKLQQFMRD